MKRRFTRRHWFAAWFLGAPFVRPDPVHADTLGDIKVRIGQAQTAVKDLTARIQGQQSTVSQLRGVTGVLSEELRRVDAELMEAVSKFRQAEADLNKVQDDIQRLEGEIGQKEEAVAQRAGVYGTRLRAMYKFTRTSPLEQLLSARSFGEALQRLTMMQAVTRVDNRLLGQLRQEHDELLKAREALAKSQEQATGLRDELDRQRQLLEDRRAAQASLFTRARQEQQVAEGTLSDLDREAKEHSSRIASLQAQYNRELEELERKRLEEQRRQDEQRRQEEQRRQDEQRRQEEQRRQDEQRRQEEQRRMAQATATAQARATATAQTQAQLQSPAVRTTSVAQPTPVPSAPRPILPLPGSINTTKLQPSSYNMIFPVSNPVVTTEFGERNFAQSYHTGIDLAQDVRTPVVAVSDGVVIERGLAVPGKPNQSYGMMVTIAHDRTISSLYAHLDDKNAPPVKAGDKVARGQVIGYIGMTGITSGPHLHFEVRENGNTRNPRNYLPR